MAELYDATVSVQVNDEKALWSAARASYKDQNGGDTEAELNEFFGTIKRHHY